MRNRRFAGLKFRRQHPLGLYIADFYSAAVALVIELDGDMHSAEEEVEYDRVRHQYLRSLEVEVLRFWNFDPKENPDGLLQRVRRGVRSTRGLAAAQNAIRTPPSATC